MNGLLLHPLYVISNFLSLSLSLFEQKLISWNVQSFV